MSTKLKTRTLNKPSKLSSTQPSTVSEAKSLLNSGTLENIEIEYIKNLQTQVYFLELECNYLREQLEHNGLNSKSQHKTPKNHDDVPVGGHIHNNKNFEHEKQSLLNELATLKKENAALKERADVLNSERNQTHSTLEMHHQELRRSKENFASLDAQLDQTRKDNTRLRSELTEAKLQLNNREHLVNDLRKQANDASSKKTSTHELRNTVTELNTKLTKEVENTKYLEDDKQRLLKEVANYQQQLSEYKLETQRLNGALESSLKQNETDLILAQKNASILKSNVEQLESALYEQKSLSNKLQTQIEEYIAHERVETKNALTLKSRSRDAEEALEAANVKINELTNIRDELLNRQQSADGEQGKLLHENDVLKLRLLDYEKRMKELSVSHDESIRARDNQLNLTRAKTDALQKSLDEHLNQLKTEKTNYKSLKVHNDSFVLQDQSNQKLIASLKGQIHDLELALHKSESKQNEILALKNELSSTGNQLNNKDEEINFLKQQIDALHARLNEAERLKDLEKVIKSQHWEEFGAIAENMRNLTRQFNRRDSSSTEQPVIGFDRLISTTSSTDTHVEVEFDEPTQMPQAVIHTQLSEPSAPPANE